MAQCIEKMSNITALLYDGTARNASALRRKARFDEERSVMAGCPLHVMIAWTRGGPIIDVDCPQ